MVTRWNVTTARRRTALIAEAAVQGQVEAAVAPYFYVQDLAQGYRGHYLKDSHGAPILGPDGKPARVDETTRQDRGLPDLFLIPVPAVGRGGAWLEIKRPRIVLDGKVVQARYQRSYEQEQFHVRARAAGIAVATVESAAMALSYLAWAGYVIPAEGLDPWDDTCQAWYTDPKAQPASARRMTRKVPRRAVWGWQR
jgi:hypothetical protein